MLTRHESEGGQASPRSHTWLPYLTPNGVIHKNNTRIEAFYAFIIVEYQLFTTQNILKFHAEKIMDFEHPS